MGGRWLKTKNLMRILVLVKGIQHFGLANKECQELRGRLLKTENSMRILVLVLGIQHFAMPNKKWPEMMVAV